MPRIAAGTVKEHNERVLAALVAAAEDLLRADPTAPLTAGAVAARAGIARNSIYKHVGSVDELRGLVVRRHLPVWASAVGAALEGVDDPRERVRVWARANLAQAAQASHGWLAALAVRGEYRRPTAGAVDAEADNAHRSLDRGLREDLGALLPAEWVELTVDLVRALVDAGMKRVDAGDPLEEVTGAVDAAVCGLLDRAPVRP